MNKVIKIFICTLILVVYFGFSQFVFAKYVIETSSVVAKLNIDRCKPEFALIDVTTSNASNPNIANKTHTITGFLKLYEKNVASNILSNAKIFFLVNGNPVSVKFNNFFLKSSEPDGELYKFIITNVPGNGPLSVKVVKDIVTDKSGLKNDEKIFSTNIVIKNT